jgi:magnesium transporter
VAQSEAASTPSPVTLRVVTLDFANKHEESIEPAAAAAALEAGHHVWIDAEVHDRAAARPILEALGVLDPEALDDALSNDPLTRLARFEHFIHLVVSGCRPRGQAFDLERVDVFIGPRFLATIHCGPVLFLSHVKRDYRADFQRHAQSLSFLLYELWDHLIDNYLSVQKLMEERVEQLQSELRREDIDDSVFRRISELGADLLHFRKILLPARAVLTDLSTRKSIFISEPTQPFLANMVGTVEHVLQDLLVDRDILSESLNLYMSMVGHRTNEVMKRLTVVSVIFLPLTFLVGVYGMNFELMPELKWHYGYGYFWLAALLIIVGLAWLLRRHRLL